MNREPRIVSFKDAIWGEANQLTGHVHTRRATLATGTWRDINDGVDPTATQTEQVTEPIGLLEDRSEIDEYEVKLAPNPKQFRYDEDLGHLEGNSQTFAGGFLYGDRATTPNGIDGIATRYNDLSLDNVWDGGASGGTSVYFVQWGKREIFLIHPRNGANRVIEMNDKGLELITKTGTKRLYMWVTQFVFNAGIVVRQHRCIQRIANIATSGTSNLFDEDLGIEALIQMKNKGEGAIMYCNKTVLAQLEIIAKDKPNVLHTVVDPWGKPQNYFRGHPIHLLEAIKDDETAVA